MANKTRATDDGVGRRTGGDRRAEDLPIAHRDRRAGEDRRSGRDRRTEPR